MQRLGGIALALTFMITPALAQNPPAAAPAPAVATPENLPEKVDWLAYKDPYASKATDITQPHRTTEEVSTWAQQAISDVLSFSQKDYRQRILGFKKYFIGAGWQPYATWLKEVHLIEMVAQEGYSSVGTVVNSPPDILSQGMASGAYHWLVRVPAIISLQRQESKGDMLGQYYLFLDVQRVEAKAEEDGLVIAGWRAKRSNQ